MKNNQIAESFLRKAEERSSNVQKAREALENFNQALRFALPKSHIVADAFVGRARVYAMMGHYQKSIDNVQLALQCASANNASDESLKALKVIQDEILAKISSSTDIRAESEEFFTLSHDVHKKIPFIAECLEVRENEVYGRYIMTTKDLEPGDIVVVEEPFYKILDPKVCHSRCSVCLKQNILDLLPCSKCSHGEFTTPNFMPSILYQIEIIHSRV